MAGGGTTSCESFDLSWVLLLLPSPFHQNTDDAKIILANAVQHVGQSVKVWLTAAGLETEPKAKKRVLRKGE